MKTKTIWKLIQATRIRKIRRWKKTTIKLFPDAEERANNLMCEAMTQLEAFRFGQGETIEHIIIIPTEEGYLIREN